MSNLCRCALQSSALILRGLSEAKLLSSMSTMQRWNMRALNNKSKALFTRLPNSVPLPPLTREFLETGEPAPTIVAKVKEWSADLIVIASHGRAGVTRAPLGRRQTAAVSL